MLALRPGAPDLRTSSGGRGHRRPYADIAAAFPETDWVYGETGFPWGGRFWPHRTHRNGLSFDFMVPLKDGQRFPAHIFNRFGYDAEFDAQGHGAAGDIDFTAIARHLKLLDRHARTAGGGISRVIFAPDLQDDLFGAPGGSDLAQILRFNAKPAWVRHDEHYHVDFNFPCQRGRSPRVETARARGGAPVGFGASDLAMRMT